MYEDWTFVVTNLLYCYVVRKRFASLNDVLFDCFIMHFESCFASFGRTH